MDAMTDMRSPLEVIIAQVRAMEDPGAISSSCAVRGCDDAAADYATSRRLKPISHERIRLCRQHADAVLAAIPEMKDFRSPIRTA